MSLRSSARWQDVIDLHYTCGRQHSHHSEASKSREAMLEPVLGEISAAMPHQNIITYIDAGRRARSMRMLPSLPMTIGSVNRLLFQADRRLTYRIPNATQAQSKRIDEFTPSESSLM
eukprot:1631081-Pleurochrysis_carterae.AAC.2